MDKPENPAICEDNIGKMFSVPWSPNPHKLEEIRARHCQLHGERIGNEALFRKRRNSEKRPWGSLSVVDTTNAEISLLAQRKASHD